MKKANNDYFNAGLESFSGDEVKDSKLSAQEERYFQMLSSYPMTMKMASEALKIDRANLCRYTKRLRESGRICCVFKERCKVTGWKAGYLTTNLRLCPHSYQLDLFRKEGENEG